MRWIIAGIVLLAVVLVWDWLRFRRNQTSGPPAASIVLLLSQPRNLNVYVLAPILSDVAGTQVKAVDIADESAEADSDQALGAWIAGESPRFIAHLQGMSFLIHNQNSPYIADPAAASQSLPDLRLRYAVREHKAWLAMDVLDSTAATVESLRLIARVISKLGGPDCLAIYHPPSQQLVAWTQEVSDKLQSEDPNRTVFDESDAVPVITVDDDDPRFKAAVAEAQSRFPEFQSAYEQKNGSDFLIKVPITYGDNTEHVWVEVERIEEDQIEGRLISEPVDLGDLKVGSRILAKRSEIEDWSFSRDSSPVGRFSIPVIEQIMEEMAAKH